MDIEAYKQGTPEEPNKKARPKGLTNEYIRMSLEKKLKGAIALRDYALNSNLYVPNDMLRDLRSATNALYDSLKQGPIGSPSNIGSYEELDVYMDLDLVIRDLTAITYPTTIDTILFNTEEEGKWQIKKYRRNIYISAIMATIFLIFCFSLGNGPLLSGFKQSTQQEAAVMHDILDYFLIVARAAQQPMIALSLGLLGSVVAIIFALIGELSGKVINRDDISQGKLRLLLGPVVGLVFYYAFASDANSKGVVGPLLLLPFLAGFSTKLVLGILNQSIQAVQLVLGLEDKTSRLLQRKAKQGDSKYQQ